MYFPKIMFHGNNNIIEIGEGTHLYKVKMKIFGNNHKLFIGKNCIIKDSILCFEDGCNSINIDCSTSIESAHIACVGYKHNVNIGEDCMISSNVYIANTDSHSIIGENSMRLNPEGNINIGKHVWIGTDVSILRDVEIESNCIVGAKSLITSKRFLSNSIIAGIPAKVIKNNLSWRRDRI